MRTSIAIIIVLVGVLVWFGFTIIRLENYHYADQVGLCQEFNDDILKRFTEKEDCIKNTKTRTSPFWHLFYALKDF